MICGGARQKKGEAGRTEMGRLGFVDFVVSMENLHVIANCPENGTHNFGDDSDFDFDIHHKSTKSLITSQPRSKKSITFWFDCLLSFIWWRNRIQTLK
jgi:hypothetical protein